MKQFLLVCILSLSTLTLLAQGDDDTYDKPNLLTNDVLKSGFFIEGLTNGIVTRLPSFGYYKGYGRARSDRGAGIGFRMGSRFYFGSSTKYRPGMNLNYLRFQMFLTRKTFLMSFAPIGLGFANLINFNDEMGLEVNFNVMLNFLFPFTRKDYRNGYVGDGGNADAYWGLIFGPTVKFRYKVLAVGLDMGYSPLINLDEDSGPGNYTYFGVCIGVKL